MLQRSWEMAVILDFLERFRPHLSLSRGFTAHELESALILSPGGEGLLGSLHMVTTSSLVRTVLRLTYRLDGLHSPQSHGKTPSGDP